MTGGSLPKTRLPEAIERSRARFGGGRSADGARDAERAQPFQWLVRTGFLARGVTYGIVGALALALAFGAGSAGAKPDQQGALTLVARAPLGSIALIAIAAGLLAYALWKLSQAAFGRGPEGGGGSGAAERAINAGGGVAYLLLCAVAVEIVAGSGSSASGGSPKHAAAGVLSWPGGTWIVGLAGIALIGGAAYQAYYGVSERFTEQDKTEQMSPDQRRHFCLIGKVGFVARAIVFALIGYFLARSALHYDPGSAVGVDGALARLHHQALGPWLVGLVGLGLLIFGLFSLYEARYRRL